MGPINHLLASNAAWAARCRQESASFFEDLSAVHNPKYLWLGCSDARVPANTLLGLQPGEVFVHRNIGSQVLPSDLNCLSVIQHAVESLQVQDIIVCGHYGCGGIQGALGIQRVGSTVDNWLGPLKALYLQHQAELDAISDPIRRANRLSDLNVRRQVLNVCQTSFVREAWRTGRDLSVHGLVYDIKDGLLRSLDLCISSDVL